MFISQPHTPTNLLLCAYLIITTGVSKNDAKELSNYIKEHLSCVRELDVLVRFKSMSQGTNTSNGSTDAIVTAADGIVNAMTTRLPNPPLNPDKCS